jgi:peptidyl-prolyl cis-trans isomerase A (cyclophilin A)
MVTRAALILMCLGLTAGAQTGAAQTKTSSPAQTAPPKKSTAQAAAKTTPKANPTAIIHTTAGDMTCTLLADRDPKAVASFVGLSKGTKPWKDPNTGKTVHGKPLYDGVIFHRTIPDFMIQAGDPTGTGSGDPGFEITDQLYPDLLFDQPGRLAMANRGGMPNTSSSQFFITEKELPFLNPCFEEAGCPQMRRGKGTGYIIFGQCDDSTVELVKKIARMPCQGGQTCSQPNSRPQNPVKITHVEIKSAGSAASPAPKKPAATKTATPAAPPKK